MRQARANKRNPWSRKYQRWLLPAAILLLAAALVLTAALLTQTNRIHLEEPVYQFYQDQRVEYDTGTKLTYGKYHAVFEQGKERSEGDETPIYSQVSRQVILPGDAYWLDPTSGREWLVPALSSVSMDDSGAVWCKNGKTQVRLEGGFLSDAAGTYLFLDSMELRWNGRTDTIDPLSFYSVSADGTLRVYAYEQEMLLYENNLGETDTGTSTRGYSIDFTTGIYTGTDGRQRLLVAAPGLLTSLFQAS